MDKEGAPRLYIRILADLEDYLREKHMGRPRAPWTEKVSPGSISASWLTSRTISGKSIWDDQEHRLSQGKAYGKIKSTVDREGAPRLYIRILADLEDYLREKHMGRPRAPWTEKGKAYGKTKSTVDREGAPRLYIRILADLEDYLNELWDVKGRKRMKDDAKAWSTLRQKIQKYSRDFESRITSSKQNPEPSADEDAEKNEDSEGSSGEDEDEDRVSAATFSKKKSDAPSGESREFLTKMEDEDGDSEDSEDEEDGDTGSASSDSDSEEEEGKQTALASRFLKKAPTTDEDKKAVEKKREDKAEKHDRKSQRLDEEEEDDEGGEWERVRGGVPLVKEKPKMVAKGTEITHAVVIKKRNEILQAQGKKGTDGPAQIELLQLLVEIAAENNLGEGIIIKISFNIIASLYDYSPNLATYVKPETWGKCLDYINEPMDTCLQIPTFLLERIFWKRVRTCTTLTSHCVSMAAS
ncbi:Eukaryotic translation initiation factor 3 subunit C [Saguinus oedipus]|uniref:Eukaryotic translation initiation factor 3 subunit C n=1 Tax=Saguinus oedipus TaxID=9490 RepID=A0ABQ9V6C6_SAGOE|nr:Eukaryotic translation initiation factor 3 subunit C [Saguinus oedipus]